jgi:hypothetical protein
MNKKLVAIVAAVLLISAAGIASAQNVDTKIIGFESNIVYSYSVSNGSAGYGTAYGLNLTLTDYLTAGFVYTNGLSNFDNSVMLTFAYGIADKVGINLAIGQDTSLTTPLVGVGMYYNIFERKVQDTLVSVLKVKIAYDFNPATGIDAGNLILGIGLNLGL